MPLGLRRVVVPDDCKFGSALPWTAASHLALAAAFVEKDAARAYLDQHFAEPVTLEACAQAAGLAPNYLCKLFKDYVGKSVFTYLNERRIQAAMVSLRATKEKSSTLPSSQDSTASRILIGCLPTPLAAHRRNIAKRGRREFLTGTRLRRA